MTQAQALRILLSGRSAFLTGAPGTGKSYALTEFVRCARQRRRRVAVTASTGVAATHIDGTTLHAWSGLGTRDRLTSRAKAQLYADQALRRRYRETDVLVIDEVSMLHGVRLNLLSELCQLMRNSSAPFGGLQVVLVGDLFQMPPVTRRGEVIDFMHTSAAWAELDPAVCYLTEQHRQQHGRLHELLEAMRTGVLQSDHIDALRGRLVPQLPATTSLLRLCTHNRDADELNRRELAILTGKSRRYVAAKFGPADKLADLAETVRAPGTLELKKGAEVMFVVNSPEAGFANGTRGLVTGFRKDRPVVRLTSGRTVTVQPHTWALAEDGRECAEIVQLPLRLGWAITIHKSQGMSLDAAVIDLRKCFMPGMGYVALSRVRSMDGVFLTGTNQMALQMHPEIVAFDRQMQEMSARLEQPARLSTREHASVRAALSALLGEPALRHAYNDA